MGKVCIFSGKSTPADLLTNGIGFLDATGCEMYEEINGQFSVNLTVHVGSKHAEAVTYGAIIRAMTPRGLDYFTLDIPEKTLTTISVKGWQISDALGNPKVLNAYIDAKSGIQALPIILASSPDEQRFTGVSDITTVANMRIAQQSPLAALIDTTADNCFLNRWGGEIWRNKFTVNIMASIGSDKGYKISKGKNLLGVTESTADTGYTNRIIPKCLSADDVDLFLPEVYIDSAKPNPFDNSVHAKFYKCNIKVGQTDAETGTIPYPTNEAAYTAMREIVAALYAEGADSPETTVDISFAHLKDTIEYKSIKDLFTLDIQLGDTITYDNGSASTKMRVVSYKYDSLTERYMVLTLGNKKPNIAKSIVSSDIDLSALKSEVTQTVKQSDTYYGCGMNHEDGFVCTATDGHYSKFNADVMGFFNALGKQIGGMVKIGDLIATISSLLMDNPDSLSYIKLDDFAPPFGDELPGYTLYSKFPDLPSFVPVLKIGGWSNADNTAGDIVFVNAYGTAFMLTGGASYILDKNGNTCANSAHMQAGSCVLNSASAVAVTFSEAFQGVPVVMLTIRQSGSVNSVPRVTAVSATGFSAIMGGSGVSGIVVDWLAVDPSDPTI